MRGKVDLDVAGHYSRADLFRLDFTPIGNLTRNPDPRGRMIQRIEDRKPKNISSQRSAASKWGP